MHPRRDFAVDPKDFIEPSLADALPIRAEIHKGSVRYVVHGICIVRSMQEALDLVVDRRVTPRTSDESVFQCCGGVRETQAGVHGVLDRFTWEAA
jgi:hypothetical protein